MYTTFNGRSRIDACMFVLSRIVCVRGETRDFEDISLASTVAVSKSPGLTKRAM
jgi:hypothetical protein